MDRGHLVDISPVKREKILREEKKNKRIQMRAALPVLNIEEIRRHRLPGHEALIRQMETSGFRHSANYVRGLIQFQEELRRRQGPDSLTWQKPRLMREKEVLVYLKEGLEKAELAQRKEEIPEECDAFLEMAIRFGFEGNDWWWLADQLFLQAAELGIRVGHDGGRVEATVRYAYGKFLYENKHENEIALNHLDTARELSLGMSLWHARKYFGKYQGTLHVEICKVIYKLLLDEARKCLKAEPEKAQKLCVLAKKRAHEACDHQGETDALLLKGECEMFVFDTSTAINTFLKALGIQMKHESKTGMCETRMHLSVAFLKHGWLEKALNQLQELKAYAEKNNIKSYIAHAIKYLGEYYLKESSPNNSTPLLITALKLFHEEGNLAEQEQCRHLAAMSIGVDMMPKFIDLILKCGETGPDATDALVRILKWKDSRETFWIGTSVSATRFVNLDYEKEQEQDVYEFEGAPIKIGGEESNLEMMSLTTLITTDVLGHDNFLVIAPAEGPIAIHNVPSGTRMAAEIEIGETVPTESEGDQGFETKPSTSDIESGGCPVIEKISVSIRKESIAQSTSNRNESIAAPGSAAHETSISKSQENQ